MPTDLEISLVIPTFNRAGMLADALDSIAESRGLSESTMEVIVVDNGSDDETPEVVATRGSSFPIQLRSLYEARRGAIHAYNHGWTAARGDIVVFMDDDQIIDPHYLGRVASVFRDTGADVVGGPIRFQDWDSAPEWLRRRTETVGQIDLGPETRETTSADLPLKGGNLAARRKMLRRVDGFTRAFQVGGAASGSRLAPGFEDDFQDRVRAAGGSVVYSPDLVQLNRFTVDQRRKAYWRRHAVDLGRGAFRLNATAWQSGRLVLGVPAWLPKRLLKAIGGYARTLARGSEADRFDGEHEICHAAGMLHQAWRLRRLNGAVEDGSSVAASR